MLSRIIDEINGHQTFLLTSHLKLDGDAIGSELAFYSMLAAMGKEAVVYNEDKTPHRYTFLPGVDRIVNEWPSSFFDVAIVLDCSTIDRVGKEAGRLEKMGRVIDIDHHKRNSQFASLGFQDEKASSTGEMLYRLFKRMELMITKDAAINLYAAILTDTGGFRYRNTGKATLLAASHLIERGADPQWISENIYDNEPLAKMKLLAKVLETLSFDLNHRVASMAVRQDALSSTGALIEHTEDFVDLPRSIKDVEISILYNEVARDEFKVSMRSKKDINVENIARIYGGGGHLNAAGFRVKGHFEQIKRDVLHTIANELSVN